MNLWLLAVVIMLAGLLWLDHRPSPELGQPLTALQADAVRSLRVERSSQEAVHLSREQGGWQMQAPWSVRADGERVRRLLGVLSQRSDTVYALAGVDASKLGLNPARASLIVDGIRLSFGDSEPLTRRRYVQLGDQVHLLEDRFFYQLNSRPADFVDPRPLPPDAIIEMLRLPDLTLTRSAQGWQVEPPMNPETHSADAPQVLIDAWQVASASDVAVAQEQEGASAQFVAIQLRGVSAPLRFGLRQDADGIRLIDARTGLAWQFGKYAADSLLKLREIVPDA